MRELTNAEIVFVIGGCGNEPYLPPPPPPPPPPSGGGDDNDHPRRMNYLIDS